MQTKYDAIVNTVKLLTVENQDLRKENELLKVRVFHVWFSYLKQIHRRMHCQCFLQSQQVQASQQSEQERQQLKTALELAQSEAASNSAERELFAESNKALKLQLSSKDSDMHLMQLALDEKQTAYTEVATMPSRALVTGVVYGIRKTV